MLDFKIFSLMNTKQKQYVVMILLIPVVLGCIGYYSGIVHEQADIYARESESSIELANLTRMVSDENVVYDMIKAYEGEYTPSDIIAGADPKYVDRYFKYIPPAKEVVVVVERPPAPKQTVTVVKKAPTQYYKNEINLIYAREGSAYIIIDGKLVQQGGYSPSGMKVLKIENKRVLLEGKRGTEWVTLKF